MQKTHLLASRELVGTVVRVETGICAETSLTTVDEMAVDEKGLIHGGFIFGLADLAAMAAVNDPFVVLATSSVKFLKPVVSGEQLIAHARITKTENRKRWVWCDVFNEKDIKVFEGEFFCVSLKMHVLEK